MILQAQKDAPGRFDVRPGHFSETHFGPFGPPGAIKKKKKAKKAHTVHTHTATALLSLMLRLGTGEIAYWRGVRLQMVRALNTTYVVGI